MKIAVLGVTNIRYMPYLKFYLDQLDPEQHEIHALYWERNEGDNVPLPDGVIGHSLCFPMLDVDPPLKKAQGFWRYARFANRTLKQIRPDLLIVTHTTTALMVWPLLRGRYKGRYIFDYRDMTYEHHGFYRKATAKIVEGAALSFTSSDGFRHVLPSCDTLLTSHNIPNDAYDIYEQFADRMPHRDGPVRIAFWGLFRHVKLNRAVIEALSDDDRFELHYYGRAQGVMEKLVKDSAERYQNVFFHGEYVAADRLVFARETDMIHNMYEVTGTMAHAMSNKYYDGLLFNIPQLCTKGSYMGRRCEESGVGFALDPFSPTFADEVYNLYQTYDAEQMHRCYREELDRVMAQVKKGTEALSVITQS